MWYVVELLIDGMKWLVCAVIGAFLHWCLWIMVGLFSVLPDEWTVKLGVAYVEGWKYWTWADQFLPLSLSMSLIASYWAWLLACRLMAWAMKMMRG